MSNVFAQAQALAFGKTEAGGPRRGHARGGRPAPRVRGQPADERDPRRAADAADARRRWSRSTSTASSPRARSGTSTRSTSGASSSARSWRSGSFPSSSPTQDPDLQHDSSTNALIRRYRGDAERRIDKELTVATDTPMQLGMVGLGRMGAGLVRRLMARRPPLRRLRRLCETPSRRSRQTEPSAPTRCRTSPPSSRSRARRG